MSSSAKLLSMHLKSYLQTHTQAALARSLGVTPGAVNQWVAGTTTIPAERCIQIEKATGGVVRCEDLRPDVDWAYIRGSLPNPKMPPALDVQAVGATYDGASHAVAS